MKTLYLIGGTMGIGKTTVCELLKLKLPNCIFLDGDWCWNADPFVVTDETKAMVMDNICHTLQNFVSCSAYENILFCWVMHEQSIINEILSRLDLKNVNVKAVSLVCSDDELISRLSGDIACGKRKDDIITRSLARQGLYDLLDTVKVCTDEKSPEEVAECIMGI